MDSKVVVRFDKSHQVWEAADNGKTGRPTLEVVQLRRHMGKWWLVAINGFMLAMVPAECQHMDHSEVNPEMTFVINADVLKAAAKGSKSVPALIVVNNDGTERVVEQGFSDPEFPQPEQARRVQYQGFSVTVGEMTIAQDHSHVLTFPDWTPILVAVNGKCANPVFNPMLLLKAAKALGRYGADIGSQGLILRQNDANEPIVVYRTPEDRRSEETSPYIGPTALIMPLNTVR